jgi:hypothetical protein
MTEFHSTVCKVIFLMMNKMNNRSIEIHEIKSKKEKNKDISENGDSIHEYLQYFE